MCSAGPWTPHSFRDRVTPLCKGRSLQGPPAGTDRSQDSTYCLFQWWPSYLMRTQHIPGLLCGSLDSRTQVPTWAGIAQGHDQQLFAQLQEHSLVTEAPSRKSSGGSLELRTARPLFSAHSARPGP